MHRKSTRMMEVLEANDRAGEKKTAFFQAFGGASILAVNTVYWLEGDWVNLNIFAMIIAIVAIMSCYFRYVLAKADVLNNPLLHVLSVVDGILIFMLILSQSIAFNLPIEAGVSSPYIIFLIVYTGVRVVRFDPFPILLAGTVVNIGWWGMLAYAVYNQRELTDSYFSAIYDSAIYPIGQLEMSAGFVLFFTALAFAAKASRNLISKSAHLEDLAEANAKVRDNANQLQAILDNSVDGIMICDDEGEILQHNSALARMLGYENEQLKNVNISTLISRDKIKTMLEQAKRTLEGCPDASRDAKSLVTEAKTRDDNIVPVELSMSLFPRNNQQCFAIFVRDISERMVTEQNERTALKRFEKVVNSAMDAIIIIDQDNRIINFNPAAEEIFGYKCDEVLGCDIGQKIIPSRLRAAHNRGVKNYKKTGVAPVLNQRYEVPAMTASGDEIDIELDIKELDSHQGKMFIGYARDVSEQNKVKQELVRAKEAAEEANRTKSRFLNLMSQEITAPLNGVLGLLSALESQVECEDTRRMVRSAAHSGENVMSIMNDIHDLSRLEAGKIEITPHDFDTHALLEHISALVHDRAEEKGLLLEAEISDGVHPTLFGDSSRIRQILLNLVDNALKFTSTGKLEITVKPGNRSSTIFAVHDTGIGISQSDQKHLFDQFDHAETAGDEPLRRTGLGLAICRALVHSMDGNIWVSSQMSKGSTFYFELPLKPGNPEKVIRFLNSDNQIMAKIPEGLKVLAVENHDTNQIVVNHMLESLGCQSMIVANSAEVPDAVRQGRFDAVLMNVTSSEMDELSATIRTIRAMTDVAKAGMPVIALSDSEIRDNWKANRGSGVDYFLTKPVNKAELAYVLANLEQVGKRRLPPVSGEWKGTRTPRPQRPSPKPGKVQPFPSSFDKNTLDQLFGDLSGEERQVILAHMEADLGKFQDGLQKALAHEDPKLAEAMAHGLKGVSGMFGANSLSLEASALKDLIHFEQERAPDCFTEEIGFAIKALMRSAEEHIKLFKEIKNMYIVDIAV